VYDRLVGDGHTVLAAAEPAARAPVRRVLHGVGLSNQLDGPVVLVGHSYGGAVITVAGSSDKVAGARVRSPGVAPDEGESVNDLQGRFPSLAMGPLVAPGAVGRRPA